MTEHFNIVYSLPGGLAAARQSDEHDALALVPGGDPRVAADTLLLAHAANLDVVLGQGVLPVLLGCSLFVNTEVDLEFDVPRHDVREEGIVTELLLGNLESVSLVLAILSECDIDFILGEVNERSDDITLGKLFSVVFELLVRCHLALTGGVTPGVLILTQHERGSVGGPAHPEVVAGGLLLHLHLHIVHVLHLA